MRHRGGTSFGAGAGGFCAQHRGRPEKLQEAVACKHCSHDLRIVRPVVLEIQDIVLELDKLQRELDRTTMAQGGKPNVVAYQLAGLLGRHVGEDQMRRRARTIQHLMTTAGPLMGVVATAAGSVYAGLKGVIGG